MFTLRSARASRIAPCLVIPLVLVLLAPSPTQAEPKLNLDDLLPRDEAEARLKAASTILRHPGAPAGEVNKALDLLAEAHAKTGGTARQRAAFRREAEALLVKALMVRRPSRATRYANVHHPVNMRAAHLLGQTAAVLAPKETRRLSLLIRKALTDDKAKRRKPDEWNPEHLQAAFAALAVLNDHGTLLWMVETYRHSKEREIPFLIAAHRAMVMFRGVPGKLRYEVCDQMITAYAGVESAAERSSNAASDVAKKRIWDRIRTYTIPVLQHYAGQPRNAAGQALSTVREIREWWRDHRDLRKPPWTD